MDNTELKTLLNQINSLLYVATRAANKIDDELVQGKRLSFELVSLSESLQHLRIARFMAIEAFESLSVQANKWISTMDQLPPDETPVIILLDGMPTIGELRWETPGYEETYKAFRYWDSPENDGQDWDWLSVTHWMHLPENPSEQEMQAHAFEQEKKYSDMNVGELMNELSTQVENQDSTIPNSKINWGADEIDKK